LFPPSALRSPPERYNLLWEDNEQRRQY